MGLACPACGSMGAVKVVTVRDGLVDLQCDEMRCWHRWRVEPVGDDAAKVHALGERLDDKRREVVGTRIDRTITSGEALRRRTVIRESIRRIRGEIAELLEAS